MGFFYALGLGWFELVWGGAKVIYCLQAVIIAVITEDLVVKKSMLS